MKTFDDLKIDLGGRTGTEVQTTCPQCSHTRKKAKARCLSVNTLEGLWLCHHCDWRGSMKSGEESRSKPPKRIVKPQFEKPSVVPPVVREWFEKRGIPEEIVARHCISLQTVYMPQVEDEVLCLVFPYYRNGEVVNLKYRTVEGKFFRQVKDTEKIVYELDDIDRKTTIFVEGEIDKLSCAVAGFTSCVSVPDGAPPEGSKSSEKKFEYLVNCEAYLSKIEKIILAVDNDGPGKTLEEELARRLGPDGCWRVTWPEGCKDANDVLVKHGPEALRQCIEAAKPFPIEGVFEVVDLVDDAIALYDRGLPAGLSTGVSSIDRHYSVKAGELTIVTGIPSHGKSEWLDWLIVQLAILYGWIFAICSPENYPLARHLGKLVEKYIGKPFPKGPNPRMTSFELAQGLQWAQDHCIPWNEFDHRRPPSLTETEYISVCLGRLRRFARTYQVHVWVVAHPMKLRRREDESYPVPTPYDISGSAHWRNKADNCLCVWRDEQNSQDPVKLYVQKIRFREVGKVGVVDLRYDPLNGRYHEVIPKPEPHWQG